MVLIAQLCHMWPCILSSRQNLQCNEKLGHVTPCSNLSYKYHLLAPKIGFYFRNLVQYLRYTGAKIQALDMKSTCIRYSVFFLHIHKPVRVMQWIVVKSSFRRSLSTRIIQLFKRDTLFHTNPLYNTVLDTSQFNDGSQKYVDHKEK